MARLESPVETANGRVEPALTTCHKEALLIARTLVRAWQKFPVQIVNVGEQPLVVNQKRGRHR
jgi:hypothetical protein